MKKFLHSMVMVFMLFGMSAAAQVTNPIFKYFSGGSDGIVITSMTGNVVPVSKLVSI